MTDEQRERKKAYLREWYAKNRERQIAAVGAWPSGTVAGWILAWAGDYANEADNANYPCYQRRLLRREIWKQQ